MADEIKKELETYEQRAAAREARELAGFEQGMAESRAKLAVWESETKWREADTASRERWLGLIAESVDHSRRAADALEAIAKALSAK